MTAGNNVDPQMTLLNQKLKALADKTGSTYVDVYDISNECNLDPHPTANGHKEIADIMKTELSGMVNQRMSENAVPAAEKVTVQPECCFCRFKRCCCRQKGRYGYHNGNCRKRQKGSLQSYRQQETECFKDNFEIAVQKVIQRGNTL